MGSITQSGLSLINGSSYLLGFTVSSMTVGTVIGKVGGTSGTTVLANGTYSQTIIASAPLTEISINTAGGFDGVLDDISLKILSESSNVTSEDNVILTLDVGTLTANQLVGADNSATAIEAKDLTNISSGSLTSGERLTATATGVGLEDYDDTLENVVAVHYATQIFLNTF